MTAGSLSLCDVRVQRSRRTILDVASLEIPAGAFVGVVGANGAGKTTLLKVCAGLIRPTAGRVTVDGQDPACFNPWRRCRLRQRIGYVPQSAEYNAELPFTLRDVVAMGRTSVRPLLARLNEQDYATVDLWVERLGLAERRHQTFRSLSGGEQRKALIARAMTQDPSILMLDEPGANLDFKWKHEIADILQQLHGRTKTTVLVVSHETNVLPPACKRMVQLSDGRIVADGDAETILGSDSCFTPRNPFASMDVSCHNTPENEAKMSGPKSEMAFCGPWRRKPAMKRGTDVASTIEPLSQPIKCICDDCGRAFSVPVVRDDGYAACPFCGGRCETLPDSHLISDKVSTNRRFSRTGKRILGIVLFVAGGVCAILAYRASLASDFIVISGAGVSERQSNPLLEESLRETFGSQSVSAQRSARLSREAKQGILTVVACAMGILGFLVLILPLLEGPVDERSVASDRTDQKRVTKETP